MREAPTLSPFHSSTTATNDTLIHLTISVANLPRILAQDQILQSVSMTFQASLIVPRSTSFASLHSANASTLVHGKSTRRRLVTVTASLDTMGTESAAVVAQDDGNNLPLREIPGGYGIPYLSQLVNRWRYLYIEGEPKYWVNRMKQHNSTVIRTNMPPGWPWTDSRCIMFLDQKSYPTVFDYDKVDKYKAFAGTYMPSTSYTGGFEVCAYLDPSNKKHEQLKGYCMELLKLGSSKWAPEFHKAIGNAFLQWEYKLSQNQPALVEPVLPEFMFRFLINAITSADFDDPKIPDSEKPVCQELRNWTGFQLVPIANTGNPIYLEELLHVAPIPAVLTQGGYGKMVAFLQNYAQETLALGQTHGLAKDEIVHNLIFFLILNGHGGFCLFFPAVLRLVGTRPELQAELRKEVRAAATDGKLTMRSVMNDMPLLTSTIYEALRFNPPVPFQYARAKKDFTVSSHENRFEIKKGDFLGGANHIVCRDPKVFSDNADKFVANRFMGPEGEKLLDHLVWSNGRQSGESSVNNKQCAAKDLVPITGRLMLAELLMKYDEFKVEGVGKKLAFTSLKPRTDL